VDAPFPAPETLVRPWRTATLVASAVAVVELVLLLVASFVLFAKPLAHAVRRAASSPAAAAKPHRVVFRKPVFAPPRLARSATHVFVLNGNGRAGAAAAAAQQLHALGYPLPRTGNAARTDYATTVVMYRPGFHGEAARLARDLHVSVVAPLDGMRPAALHGAQVAVLLGAG
jgi:hypothetical protein